MDLKELGITIAKLGLPLLGAALPVPGGTAIGIALASAIGARDGSPEAIAERLGTAEGLQAAAEFQAKHEERMLELTSQQEQKMFDAEVRDKADARAREVALQSSQTASWVAKNMTAILAMLFVGATFALCAFAVSIADGELKPAQERIIMFVLGAIIPLVVMVAQYYFGSSRGDAANSQHLRDIVNRNNWH